MSSKAQTREKDYERGLRIADSILGVSVDFIMYGKNEENSELLSEAMDVLSDMDELQIRQCLAMMKAMKSVSVEK